MRKSVCLLAVLSGCLLCGCSDLSKNTSGIVDCYSIAVTNLSSSVYSAQYSISYSGVYQYKNSTTGESVYTDEHSPYTSSKIRAYEDRYSSKHTDYTYVGFIGWLTKENNYYLDLDKKIVIAEVKWSEYKYEKNPDYRYESTSSADNNAAYHCASSNYYLSSDFYYDNKLDDKVTVYAFAKDTTQKSLERRSYVKLGEDCTIAYQAKWF